MINPTATQLKLLLVSELNGEIPRVTSLCEHIVCSDDNDVDAVLVCGGIVAEPEPGPPYASPESIAAAEGDMMAIISRLETIVCRVLYAPGAIDPPSTRPPASRLPPNLTQYSVNCHSRAESLIPGVGVMGEERYLKLVGDGKDPAENWELLIVLRDLSAVTALPSPQPMSEATVLDFHHIEIVGGQHRTLDRLQPPIVFPGALRGGQFAILELAKRSADGAWAVVATRLETIDDPTKDQ